jgi:hypothetical protein
MIPRKEVILPEYNFIMAGGGAAGLSLDCHLVRTPAGQGPILIIDRDAKQKNDRTWCFWTTQPTLFDQAIYRSWEQIRFTAPGFDQLYTLQPYRYQMIRDIDFYQEARQQLAGHANVTFLRLFQRNSIQHVFRFLDEVAPLGEDLRLLATLPLAPFMKVLVKLKFLRRV